MHAFLAIFALLAVILQASAFVQPQPFGTRISSVKRQTKHELQMLDINIVRDVVAVPTMYALMSFNEYVTHRWYQHAEFNKDPAMQKAAQFLLRKNEPIKIKGGGHVEHHAETYDDMTLKTHDTKWMESPAAKLLNSDEYRGTAFNWKVVGMMMLQMVPTTFPVFKLLGFSALSTVGWIVPSILLHTIVWNTLHPDMHGLPTVALRTGPPSEWFAFLRKSAYFRWLWANHQGHHVAGGQANYNVCCPLMDHVFGTYQSEAEWRPNMRPKKAEQQAEGVAEEELVAAA